MTTNIPTDRWGHSVLSGGEGFVETEVFAGSAAEAELRSLAVMDYDYEDDLRDAVAEARPGNTSQHWLVRITMGSDR